MSLFFVAFLRPFTKAQFMICNQQFTAFYRCYVTFFSWILSYFAVLGLKIMTSCWFYCNEMISSLFVRVIQSVSTSIYVSYTDNLSARHLFCVCSVNVIYKTAIITSLISPVLDSLSRSTLSLFIFCLLLLLWTTAVGVSIALASCCHHGFVLTFVLNCLLLLMNCDIFCAVLSTANIYATLISMWHIIHSICYRL